MCHRGESGRVECLIDYVRNCDWVKLLKYCKEQSKYVCVCVRERERESE